MRVTIGDKEVFSKKYETFEMMSEEYIDHETKHGRRVPDYALDAWLMLFVSFVLNQVVTQLRAHLSRTRDRQESQEQSELEEERYRELLDKLDELERTAKTSGRVPEHPSRVEQVGAESNDRVLTLLQWARENNVKVRITLETDAEGDLEEALNTIMKQEPEV